MQTKKISFILAMFFATFFQVAKAQSTDGLSNSDLQKIVQQCIDLPGLQTFYPTGSGDASQMSIVNYPFVFPSEVVFTRGGHAVHFVPKESIDKSSFTNYFMFRRIQPNGSTAKLVGNYYYTVGANHLNKSIAIDYTNNSGVWTITNSTIN